MRREGDVLVFESEAQHQMFENGLLEAEGAEILVSQLLHAIGRARHRACECWDAVQLFKKPGERCCYDWVTRTVEFERRAESSEEKQADGESD